MSGEIQTGHQNVIKVDKKKLKTTEEMVHELLKRKSSAAETEGHLGELKEAKRSDNAIMVVLGT